MAVGSLFGGFAKAFGQRLVEGQEKEQVRQAEERKAQLDLLMDQANRPDLRPELRPAIINQMSKLIGLKNKPGKDFQAGLDTVMGMLTGPQEVQTTERKVTDYLPSAAMTTGGVKSTIQATGIPGTQGYYERQVGQIQPPAPGTANIKPSPILQDVQATKTLAPFLSREEMQQQQLQGLEGKLKLEQKYKDMSDREWQLLGQVFTDEMGKNRVLAYNPKTGETRTIDAPAGSTQGVISANVRADATRNRAVDTATMPLRKIALRLAYENEPRGTAITDDIIDRYMQAAAQEQEQDSNLGRQVKRSSIGRNVAQATSLNRNMTLPGQPTPGGQREFSQYSKQIDELDAEYKALTKGKGIYSAIVGKKLPDGRTIQRPPKGATEEQMKQFRDDRELYLKDLQDRANALRAERSGKTLQSGPPTRTDQMKQPMPTVESEMPSGPVAKEVRKSGTKDAKLGDTNPRTGKPWIPTDTFTIKGTTYIITGPRQKNGLFPVQEF